MIKLKKTGLFLATEKTKPQKKNSSHDQLVFLILYCEIEALINFKFVSDHKFSIKGGWRDKMTWDLGWIKYWRSLEAYSGENYWRWRVEDSSLVNTNLSNRKNGEAYWRPRIQNIEQRKRGGALKTCDSSLGREI